MTVIEGVSFTLGTLAVVTYLDKDRVKYGTYYMWRHIGTSTFVFGSALIAWRVKINICGVEGYGFFACFIVAALSFLMSMLSLPFFEFKYEKDRIINWQEVKSVFFNGHYVFMILITFFVGAAISFHNFWEFWYLDGLDASPLVMGAAALVRRPIVAMVISISPYVIKRVGEINTLCITLLFFTCSFLALSFIRVYWYVLLIDTLPSSAFAFARCALMVHFSKAGSKASSGVIIGKLIESTLMIQYREFYT